MDRAEIEVPWKLLPSLALGADMKRSFALGGDNKTLLFFSRVPLSSLEDSRDYREFIIQQMKERNFVPERIIADLHPLYFSSSLAEEFEGQIVKVQHHKAHIGAVLGEYGLSEGVIGVSMDGTGYGEDGAIWGGEFFTGNYRGLERTGHIRYFFLQGGDSSAKETWRPALSILRLFSERKAEEVAERLGPKAMLVLKAIRAGVGTVRSSSAGRLFDAASFLILGIKENTYEAEGPISLEKAASKRKEGRAYPFEVREEEGELLLDPVPAFSAMVEEEAPPEEKAFSFHLGFALGIVDMVKALSSRTGIKKVALSGGVFQNRLLLGLLLGRLREEGFEALVPRRVPSHDGGIALGQIVLGGLS